MALNNSIKISTAKRQDNVDQSKHGSVRGVLVTVSQGDSVRRTGGL